MQVNAVISLVVGLSLTAGGSWVAALLEVDVDVWLRAFGVALVGHAALLGWVARKGSLRRWAQLNLGTIAPYPFALVWLSATIITSPGGRALLLVDAVVVGAVAGWHVMALRRHRPGPGTPTISAATTAKPLA